MGRKKSEASISVAATGGGFLGGVLDGVGIGGGGGEKGKEGAVGAKIEGGVRFPRRLGSVSSGSGWGREDTSGGPISPREVGGAFGSWTMNTGRVKAPEKEKEKEKGKDEKERPAWNSEDWRKRGGEDEGAVGGALGGVGGKFDREAPGDWEEEADKDEGGGGERGEVGEEQGKVEAVEGEKVEVAEGGENGGNVDRKSVV